MALLLLRRAADELDKQMKKYTKETTRILCSARVACRERERQREAEISKLKKRRGRMVIKGVLGLWMLASFAAQQ